MTIPEEFKSRHVDTLSIFKYFAYDHLPEPMRAISKISYQLAYEMIFSLPDCPELTVGLRKLLEAKDCFVRTSLELKSAPANYPHWPQVTPDAPPLPRQEPNPHYHHNPNAKDGGFGAI